MQYLLKTTTMKKISLFGLLISTVLIASCTQNDKLEKANNELSKEVAEPVSYTHLRAHETQ